MARTKKEKETIDTVDSDILNIVKGMGNDAAQSVNSGLFGDVDEYIDTGSYSFNAVLCGSIYGGFPFSRITGFAGEEGTGKTYYILEIIRHFMQKYPKAFVFYYETENSLDKKLFADRGIDPNRVFCIPVNTVEEFKTQALKAIQGFLDLDKEKRPKVLFVLDSLGMLSTIKEQTDSLEGKHVRDMTRAQVLRGAFRTLTLSLGEAKIPMLVSNHTYQVVGAYVPTKEMGGGGGMKYAASTIIFLSKKKDKDDKTKKVRGAIITATVKKGRLSRENSHVETRLFYDSGLDRYYGLLPLAEEAGVFKKVSTKYELPDGTTAFESQILANPKNYFTKPVLDEIDEYVKKEFQYHYNPDVEEELPEVGEENLISIPASEEFINDDRPLALSHWDEK